MTRIVLYIATTINGCIARKDGNIDWLSNHPNPDESDYGYGKFINTVDSIFMGRKTYEEILSFDIEWPYKNQATYILTRNSNFNIKTENTFVISNLSNSVVHEIKQKSKKDIWLVGGGQLVTEFIHQGWLDEMIIFILPIVLKEGIPLFPNIEHDSYFELTDVVSYTSGIVELKYQKKK
ncbi:MAG: dihydrofolate reductase family protein [Bacteroidales bacterium]|nr:dihydrofolate reductase family protein [Bacteroidales bacterium]